MISDTLVSHNSLFFFELPVLVMMAVLGLTNGMNTTVAFESARKIARKVDVDLAGELSG